MTFEQLNLSKYITLALSSQGITQCTQIQALSIPLILQGKDVLGLSHTGSGKTFAFALPALEMLDSDDIQVLIVCPTRELVLQTTEEIRKITQYHQAVKTVPVFGGNSIDKQIHAIKKANIVVGTPGRLMDHLRRKTLKLHSLKLLVLDEADEMLDMGFRDDIETILQSVSGEHQTVMFSATMPTEIKQLTKKYMNNPIVVQSNQQDKAQTFIKQQYVECGKDKYNTLLKLKQKHNPTIALIFCNTKTMTQQLADKLNKDGILAQCLHGDMRQSQRRIAMDKFKKHGGMLIATDVAARGIDVKDIDIVINYDIPSNSEYYIHRIGRTARAGKEGLAITIINTKKQLFNLRELMKDTGNIIEEILLDDVTVQVKSTRPKKPDNYADKKAQFVALVGDAPSTIPVKDKASSTKTVKDKASSTKSVKDNSGSTKPTAPTNSVEMLIEQHLMSTSKRKRNKYQHNDIDQDTMRIVMGQDWQDPIDVVDSQIATVRSKPRNSKDGDSKSTGRAKASNSKSTKPYNSTNSSSYDATANSKSQRNSKSHSGKATSSSSNSRNVKPYNGKDGRAKASDNKPSYGSKSGYGRSTDRQYNSNSNATAPTKQSNVESIIDNYIATRAKSKKSKSTGKAGTAGYNSTKGNRYNNGKSRGKRSN